MYYPPVGFHFTIEVDGFKAGNDACFQSVGGLSVEYETEVVKEGGVNGYEHKLPGRAKYPDLVLKRGLLVGSEITKWCLNALQNRDIQPRLVYVKLLNNEHQPLQTWTVSRAWPRKWSVSDFNATENSIVVESLELAYQQFTVS